MSKKFIGAVVGVGFIALGALTGGVLLLPGTALAFTVGSSALIATGLSLIASTLLAPKMARAGERQASETTLQLGEYPRQVLFGKGATAGSMLDAFNYGGKYGTDWEVLMIALADHECDALEGFYVNDAYVAFAGNGAVSGYNGQLEVHFLPGTEAQAWPSLVTTNGPGWTANDNCAGVACVAVAYKADAADAKNPVWPGGRPRFLWVLRGKKCYQARKDSTVTGGSGAHRWEDPATWEWTDNAAECRYQFQRGIYALDRIDQPDQLLLGRGLSEIEAPPERSIVHANVCDEAVALAAGGTEPRYRFDGLIGADEDFLTAEGYFAAAMGGVIRQPDGGIEVEPGQPKSVSAEITDLDILNLSSVKVEHFRGQADSEWVNTVVPRYVEPGQKWKMQSAPIRRVYADVIADKGQRLDTLELKQVTRGTQAQRLGEIRRRLGRLWTTGEITLGPRFAELEEGDWIGWTSDRHFDGARRVFRIESYDRRRDWHLRLALREVSAEAYGWTGADEEASQTEATQQAEPPAIGAPGAGTWGPTGGQVDGATGSLPALFVTGAADDEYAEAILIEYRVDGEADWIEAGTGPRGMTHKTITGVADGTDYEVAVTNIVAGEPGNRLVLGPVTAGSLLTGSSAFWIASRSVPFPLTSDDSSISIAAFDGVLDDGRTLSFPADTLPSLSSGRSYGVFYHEDTGDYSAAVSPSLTEIADRTLVFVGAQSTSSGGTHGSYTPPPGSGGDGSYQVP